VAVHVMKNIKNPVLAFRKNKTRKFKVSWKNCGI